eukprot:6072809-Prymnesium_polylepis.1
MSRRTLGIIRENGPNFREPQPYGRRLADASDIESVDELDRRRLTLLTAAGLLSRAPSADGTGRPSNLVRTH